MKYLHLSLRQPRETRHPMQNVIADRDDVHRSDLLTWNVGGSDDGEYLLFYVVGDRAPYEAAISEVESVLDYDLTPVDDRSFYVYVHQRTRSEDVAFRAAFARRSLVLVPPVVYTGDGRTKFTVVGDGEDLKATLDAIPDRIEIHVETVGEYSQRHGTLAESLTRKQADAVETATELGFYDVPRRATVADVAAELGCSSSTASSHLRKAEATVMRRVGDY